MIEDVDGTGAVGAVPDEDQRAAIAHDGRFLRVLGAPGSGRTTVAVELLLARIATGRVAADRAVLLAPTRRGAGTLRDEVAAQLQRMNDLVSYQLGRAASSERASRGRASRRGCHVSVWPSTPRGHRRLGHRTQHRAAPSG